MGYEDALADWLAAEPEITRNPDWLGEPRVSFRLKSTPSTGV